SANANEMSRDMNWMVRQTRNGKGLAGMLLTDTANANNLSASLKMIKVASYNAANVTINADKLLDILNAEINSGNGSIHVLLKDSVMARNLKVSMENIRKGTAGFDENMEAMKHNFLLRGFFEKREKARQDSLKKLKKQH
ncbi:MAG TPA: MCE family protein, partial [Mucilaginibacter sp.]